MLRVSLLDNLWQEEEKEKEGEEKEERKQRIVATVPSWWLGRHRKILLLVWKLWVGDINFFFTISTIRTLDGADLRYSFAYVIQNVRFKGNFLIIYFILF